MKDFKTMLGINEAEDKAKQTIQALIDTNWSSDNEAQMKAVQLLKGIALSDAPEANAFMKKLDAFTSSMKAGGEKKEEEKEDE